MNNRIVRVLKNVILSIALLNIAAMMLFEYGLHSLDTLAEQNNSLEQSDQNVKVGTIESVEQETAAKEAEEAQVALARDEEQNQNKPEEELDDNRDPNAPILELTTDHVFLYVGDRFNYMRYIKTMEDVDGSDLSHYIHLDRDVDTSVPGEIELTYRITSIITGKSDSKVLLITIQE